MHEYINQWKLLKFYSRPSQTQNNNGNDENFNSDKATEIKGQRICFVTRVWPKLRVKMFFSEWSQPFNWMQRFTQTIDWKLIEILQAIYWV